MFRDLLKKILEATTCLEIRDFSVASLTEAELRECCAALKLKAETLRSLTLSKVFSPYIANRGILHKTDHGTTICLLFDAISHFVNLEELSLEKNVFDIYSVPHGHERFITNLLTNFPKLQSLDLSHVNFRGADRSGSDDIISILLALKTRPKLKNLLLANCLFEYPAYYRTDSFYYFGHSVPVLAGIQVQTLDLSKIARRFDSACVAALIQASALTSVNLCGNGLPDLEYEEAKKILKLMMMTENLPFIFKLTHGTAAELVFLFLRYFAIASGNATFFAKLCLQAEDIPNLTTALAAIPNEHKDFQEAHFAAFRLTYNHTLKSTSQPADALIAALPFCYLPNREMIPFNRDQLNFLDYCLALADGKPLPVNAGLMPQERQQILRKFFLCVSDYHSQQMWQRTCNFFGDRSPPLPPFISTHVFSFLTPIEALKYTTVNHAWHNCLTSATFWQAKGYTNKESFKAVMLTKNFFVRQLMMHGISHEDALKLDEFRLRVRTELGRMVSRIDNEKIIDKEYLAGVFQIAEVLRICRHNQLPYILVFQFLHYLGGYRYSLLELGSCGRGTTVKYLETHVQQIKFLLENSKKLAELTLFDSCAPGNSMKELIRLLPEIDTKLKEAGLTLDDLLVNKELLWDLHYHHARGNISDIHVFGDLSDDRIFVEKCIEILQKTHASQIVPTLL